MTYNKISNQYNEIKEIINIIKGNINSLKSQLGMCEAQITFGDKRVKTKYRKEETYLVKKLKQEMCDLRTYKDGITLLKKYKNVGEMLGVVVKVKIFSNDGVLKVITK